MSSSSKQPPSSGEGALWWAVTMASGGLGVAVAWLELGPRQLLLCWALATALVMCVVIAVRGQRVGSSSWIRHSIAGGAMSTAAVGLVMGLGVMGLVWILALTATARTVRRRVLARVVGDRGGPGADVATVPRSVTVDQPPPTDPPTTDLPAVTLRDLDDEALCLAWRRSFVRLQQAPSLSARLRHVQERQRLLDELERRNPDGLAAWLASGCRAAGNPLPFLARSRSRAGQENGSTDTGNGSESDGDEGSSRAS